MRTLTRPLTAAEQAWLDRRRRLGQDLYDEVWEGTYKVAPGPTPAHSDLDAQLSLLLAPFASRAGLRGGGPLNLGEPGDYRVPDRVYRSVRRTDTFLDTVEIAVEILSPGDDARAKLGFYFVHDVQEVLFVNPTTRSVEWLVRGERTFVTTGGSTLLRVTSAWLAGAIDWPPV